MFVDYLHHLAWFKILEARPAQIGVGASFAVFSVGKNASLHGDAKSLGLALFKSMEVVEPFDKQKVGNLLDDRERVRHAARPEGVPNLIYLIADVARQHCSPLPYFAESFATTLSKRTTESRLHDRHVSPYAQLARQ